MVTEDELVAVTKRFDDAMMTFYARMQDVNKRDPRLTAAMRKYGLIQDSQAVLETAAAAITTLGKALMERDAAAAQPATNSEKAAAIVERVNRDRVIMAQQRAAGTMTEADYSTAMRELDALAAQASEWTG